jgi:lauroyl/myristoyl acyltransferase
VLLNKSLATFRVSYAFHRLPGVRWIGKQVSPLFYYQWAALAGSVSYHIYPADRRRVRYMRMGLAGNFPDEAVAKFTQKNNVHRKWLKIMTHGWPNWADRCPEWTRIEGENHLRTVLARGRGAVLLSGHSFGFTSLVAPVLSQAGYRLHRTGRGHWGDPAERWGRDWSLENWEYNSFGQDFWQHVRALNKMRQAVAKNEIVHLLATGFPKGGAEIEIDFYYNRFFLDPAALRILESLKAPVLPCFATCDESGRLLITIHPPVAPTRAEIMKNFGPLYSRYLKTQPEFAFFWRKVVQQKDGW